MGSKKIDHRDTESMEFKDKHYIMFRTLSINLCVLRVSVVMDADFYI